MLGEPCNVEEPTDDDLVLCDNSLGVAALGDGFPLEGVWTTLGLRDRVGVVGGSKARCTVQLINSSGIHAPFACWSCICLQSSDV